MVALLLQMSLWSALTVWLWRPLSLSAWQTCQNRTISNKFAQMCIPLLLPRGRGWWRVVVTMIYLTAPVSADMYAMIDDVHLQWRVQYLENAFSLLKEPNKLPHFKNNRMENKGRVQKKKSMEISILSLTPPPKVWKIIFYFFSIVDHYWRFFWKWKFPYFFLTLPLLGYFCSQKPEHVIIYTSCILSLTKVIVIDHTDIMEAFHIPHVHG